MSKDIASTLQTINKQNFYYSKVEGIMDLFYTITPMLLVYLVLLHYCHTTIMLLYSYSATYAYYLIHNLPQLSIMPYTLSSSSSNTQRQMIKPSHYTSRPIRYHLSYAYTQSKIHILESTLKVDSILLPYQLSIQIKSVVYESYFALSTNASGLQLSSTVKDE